MPIGNDRGYALLLVVTISAILLVSAGTTVRMTRSDLFYTARGLATQKAFHVAQAGIQRGIARLVEDRLIAVSNGYSFQTTEGAGEGSYDVTIGSDPLHPTDPHRKLIESVGRVAGLETKTLARAFVQPTLPCTLVLSQAGVARLVTNVAVSSLTELYRGDIHGNGDVVISVLGGLAPVGNGTLNAVGNVLMNSAVSFPSPVNQLAAYYGGSFLSSGNHADAGGVPVLGLHFANGTSGHGVQAAVAARGVPSPDYERVRKDDSTVIVTRDRIPFGDWDSTSNTWMIAPGNFSFPANKKTTYYVEGNVSAQTLSIANNGTAAIVARGWIAFSKLALAAGGAGSKSLVLIAEDDVAVGRRVLSTLPLTLEPEGDALLDVTNGVALTGAMAGSTARLFAYSENGAVWGKVSGADALGQARVSFVAKGDATLALNGTIESTVECAY